MAGGIGRGMETVLGLLVMEIGGGTRPPVMAVGLVPLAMVELGRLVMGEAGPQHRLLVRHQHHVLLLLLVPRQASANAYYAACTESSCSGRILFRASAGWWEAGSTASADWFAAGWIWWE